MICKGSIDAMRESTLVYIYRDNTSYTYLQEYTGFKKRSVLILKEIVHPLTELMIRSRH